MTIWTLQPTLVWERLQAEGVLYADLSLSPNDYLQDSYEWMRQQMLRRLPGCEGRFPWWGYYHPKPDLRKFRFGSGWPGSPKIGKTRGSVRLELSLDLSAVLLHDASAWDTSLIPAPIHLDTAEEQAYGRLSEARQRRVIRDTRERLFDIDALRRAPFYSSEDRIDAVFERLALADVVAVREFIQYL